MESLELVSRGELVTVVPPSASELRPASDSAGGQAEEWVKNGWLPSLLYFRESEDFARSEPPLYRSLETTERRPSPELDANLMVAPVEIDDTTGQKTVSNVLLQRRSVRWYGDEHLDQSRFVELCGKVLALTAKKLGSATVGIKYRLVNYRLEGLAPGVYDINSQGLIAMSIEGSFSEQMVDIMCGMEAASSADATIVMSFSAIDRQAAFPYERALRELYVDSGRIAQWWILHLEQEGLGSLITPATNDRALSDLLRMRPDDEYPIYTVTFGSKPLRKPSASK